MLCPLLILNSRILGLIWRGTTNFVTNRDTRRASCPTWTTKCWLGDTKSFNFFHFLSHMVFGIINPHFVNTQFRLQWKKLPDINVFPVNILLTSGQYSFPACWILIGQFRFQVHQPYMQGHGISFLTRVILWFISDVASQMSSNLPYLWSLLCLEIERVTDYSALCPFHAPLHKLIINWFFHEGTAPSAATLTLVEEQGKMAHADSIIQIRVSEDNVGTLSSQLQRDILQVTSTCRLLNQMSYLWTKS